MPLPDDYPAIQTVHLDFRHATVHNVLSSSPAVSRTQKDVMAQHMSVADGLLEGA